MPIAPIECRAADGALLRGEELRQGSSWVVLLHDEGEDLDCWQAVRAVLAMRGWSIVALDLRGHGGSDGAWGRDSAALDAAAALGRAAAADPTHVALVAAGVTGVLVLEALERDAIDPALRPDALVLVSPRAAAAELATLRGEGIATLVLYGQRAPHTADADELRRASIGWTLAVGVPSDQTGDRLLRGPESAVVSDQILSFLTEQRLVGARPSRPA
jgi:alpha-beta hydrolase superfamily lysophospholipase